MLCKAHLKIMRVADSRQAFALGRSFLEVDVDVCVRSESEFVSRPSSLSKLGR